MTIYEEINFKTIKHSNTHTDIYIYINYMLFIQHLAPTNRGRSSGLVPFDGLLFCEFRSKRAETTQHLQGCDCRVPWETHKNWEKLKLFREGFAQECYTVVDVSWCRDCRVLWIANRFSWGKYRSVKHESTDPGTPKTNLPFLEGTRLLDFVECCLSKVPLFLKWLSEILSDRSLPQNSFSIGLMSSCSQRFQEGQLRFLYISKRSIQRSVPLTYPSKSLRASIPSTPPPQKQFKRWVFFLNQ